MSAVRALRAGLRELRRRPAAILPHYLLGMGVSFAARTPLLLGAGAAVAILRWRGRIEPVVLELQRADWSAPGGSISPALTAALRGLVTPSVLALGLLSVLAFLALLVLARGVAAAGTLTALAAALEGRDPLRAGVDGIADDWQPFVALAVVRWTLLAVAGTVAAVGVALTATGIGAVVGLPLLFGVLVITSLALLVLAFAGPAVAVDGERTVGAIEAGARVPVQQFGAFALYAVVAFAALIGTVTLAGGFNYLGVPRLSGLLVPLVVSPVLDAIRTGLYVGSENVGARVSGAARADGNGDGTAESATDAGGDGGQGIDGLDESDEGETETDRATVRERAWIGLRRGLRELAAFVRARPLANLAGGAILLGGLGLGWLLTVPYGAQLDPPKDVAGVFGGFAAGPFVNIAANNWLVAVSQGFGGIAFGVPTVTNLLFNGVLVGVLAGIFDPLTFAALVVPHGLIEIPTLAVSGGFGLHLGGVGYRALRGRATRADVAAQVGRAAWIALGLVPPLVVAAFVEAFLTPQIAAVVLGG